MGLILETVSFEKLGSSFESEKVPIKGERRDEANVIFWYNQIKISGINTYVD